MKNPADPVDTDSAAAAPWYVYMLHCEDDSLYTGITTDPARRMREHLRLEPGGARYTRAHRPDALVAIWATDSRSNASKLEFAIKRLGHGDKLCLIARPECAEDVAREVPASTLSACERQGFWPL